MSKIQSTGLTECWGGHEAAETLVHCWQGCNVVQPLLIKANMELPYNSAATPLRSCRNWGKTYVHIKTCSAMFLAVLLYFFYCHIVNYIVVLVSGVQKNDSVIHTYIYSFLYLPRYNLLQDSDYSFLCYTVGLCCFSSFIHNGKKLGRPSVGKWRNKLWYIQILGNYSALKINELSSLQKTAFGGTLGACF